MPQLYVQRRKMEFYPKTFEGVERYVMISILSALATVCAIASIERGVIQAAIKWNDTEERTAAYFLLFFTGFCLVRGIYLIVRKKNKSLLYIAGILLGFLTTIQLGARIQ